MKGRWTLAEFLVMVLCIAAVVAAAALTSPTSPNAVGHPPPAAGPP